ncbi:MAG TPA: hypothetical protein VMN78_04945 [Longimicrobiales bacterium]|nr:hypothetical protein [Longimicrobiales bacterium]
MILLLLLLAQQPLATSTDPCEAAARLIDVDLRVNGVCRIAGSPPVRPRNRSRSRAYFPYDDLRVAGAGGAAADALHAGLETFARVSSPMAELALRATIGQALGSLERAIALDSTLIEATLAAAELAMRSRVPDDMRRALGLIRATRGESGRLKLLAAELAYTVGEPLGGGRSAVAEDDPELQRVRALELLRSDDDADRARGDSLYFDALQRGGAAMADAIGRDLGPLVAPGTTLTPEQAERFWSRLAADAAVSRPDRLSEHFRRLAYAYEAYYDWPRNLRHGDTLVTGAIFDARGHTYVRHGPPTQVVHTPPSAYMGSRRESWVYDGAWGEPLTVHFTGASRSYRFMGDYMTALSTQFVDLGLRTLLSARLSTHRLRDESGRAELLVVAAVPVGAAATNADGSGLEFTLGLTTHVLDAGRTMRASNSISASTDAVPEPGYASIPVLLPAPASGAIIRAVLRDVDSTHVGAGLSATAPAPLSRDATMSDLVTLSIDGPPTLRRHGAVLSPTPDVVGGARFGLYFELYELDVEEYLARIRVRRADAGVVDRLLNRDEVLTLTLTRRPNLVRPGLAAETLAIGAPDWESGDYEIEVEIEAGGERITRQRTLRVIMSE